jgi:putative two-component system response regulator
VLEQEVANLKILVCDDDPQDRKLIRHYLRQIAELDIITSEASQAREIQMAIENDKVDVILMDLRMPEKSGMDWLKEIVERDVAPVVMLTGYGDEEIAVQSLEEGAVGYIPKRRLSVEKLAHTIDYALQKWKELLVSKSNLEKLEGLTNVDSLTSVLNKQTIMDTVGKTMGSETLKAMAKIVEMRDPYTAGHQQRVTQLACAIAKEMGLSEDDSTGLRLAGLIHDIGKLHVPIDILTNPKNLSKAELNMIKLHPKLGYDVLKNINFPWPVAQIVYQHHERIDGSGYPRGLKGKDILLQAKILAVADVVEAMSSHRPYRPALELDYALNEIKKNKGKLYDPTAVNTCLKLFSDLGFEFD